LVGGQVAALFYDGTAWQALNFFGFSLSATNNNVVNFSVPYAQDIGGVNVLKGLYSPTPITNLVAGLLLTLRVANTNSGPTTMQADNTAVYNVLKNGQPLYPRAVVAGQIIVLFYDGTNFQLVNTRWPYYTFDEGAPPATDVPLAIGDHVNISFSNVTALPLCIATVPGVYEIDLEVSVTNSLNVDVVLYPNNTQYPSKFDAFFIQSNNTVVDQGDTLAVPIASNPQQIVSALPFIDQRPVSWAVLADGTNNMGPSQGIQGPTGLTSTGPFSGLLDRGGISFDLFNGPENNPYDLVNDVGPFIINATCVTLTANKMAHWFGGVRGGPSHGVGFWTDISTPWTSLGTIKVGQPRGGGPPNQPATLTGLCIVRRRA